MWTELQSVGLLKNERVNKKLDDMSYGFLLEFKFYDNFTDLYIRFDLLTPLTNDTHILTMSGTKYRVHTVTQSTLPQSVDMLAELVQTAMTHTRLFFIIHNVEAKDISMRFFIKTHFIPEINKQLNEKGLILN